VAFSIKKEKKLKQRLKRLRREQAENERLVGAETARAENEKNIDDIAKEYGKLKRQRRLQRFSVSSRQFSYIFIELLIRFAIDIRRIMFVIRWH
jgi:septal ring factor EnvC (AmiA/AmiB activator)